MGRTKGQEDRELELCLQVEEDQADPVAGPANICQHRVCVPQTLPLMQHICNVAQPCGKLGNFACKG